MSLAARSGHNGGDRRSTSIIFIGATIKTFASPHYQLSFLLINDLLFAKGGDSNVSIVAPIVHRGDCERESFVLCELEMLC